MGGSLKTDKDVTIVKTVELKEDIQFTDENTVLDYPPIAQGLIEGLTELKGKFFNEMKPLDALKLANIQAFDVTKTVQQN